MHPLLTRQINKHAGSPEFVEKLGPLLEAVSAAYEEADQERRLLEHTLQVTSEELTQANERLRRESEAKLRESEERYRSIFESSPETIVLADTRGVIMEINQRGMEFFDTTPQQAVGRNLADVVQLSLESAGVLREALQMTAEGRRIPPFEMEFTRGDGRTLTGYVYATVLSPGAGEPGGLVFIIADITERKMSEERLRETLRELERFNRLMVGREKRILELKREVNELCAVLGRKPAYRVDAGTSLDKLPGGGMPAEAIG